MVGCGDLGTDDNARPRYISPGGAHVIFSSNAHLEDGVGNEAAPKGTEAIYDRPVGSAAARVISLKPDGSAFGAGQNATYLATSEDTSSVVFKVGTTLYERRNNNMTLEVASDATFAGISTDGDTVTYLKEGKIFSFDAAVQPPASTEVAEGTPVSVSPDGSHVFFWSKDVLTGGEENENEEAAQPGESNLYAWDSTVTRFVGVLDPLDFKGFSGVTTVSLGAWVEAVSESPESKRGASPTRSTADGTVFIFQSHSRLTSYDNTGPCGLKGETSHCGEIYRYDPEAEAGERLSCISCDPSLAAPVGDASLQDPRTDSPAHQRSTLISNVSEDGSVVFFHSFDRLLPDDANRAQDVYEWRAAGSGEPECTRPGGCLALISSGQGEGDNYLFAMSANARDVFFWTEEQLVSRDVADSQSIYDARVAGGVADPPSGEICHGDACQGDGSAPPILPSPTIDSGTGNGNVEKALKRPCAKGKRRVKGRCVKRHGKRNHRGRHGRAGQ